VATPPHLVPHIPTPPHLDLPTLVSPMSVTSDLNSPHTINRSPTKQNKKSPAKRQGVGAKTEQSRKSSKTCRVKEEEEDGQENADKKADTSSTDDKKVASDVKEDDDSHVRKTRSPRGRKPKVEPEGGKVEPAEEVSQVGEKEGSDEVANNCCQPQHMPHLSIEEVSDPDYLAKLQAIAAAISSPHTEEEVLNSIVDVILDTGNFVTTDDSFDFDLCNLDKQSVNRISGFLKLEADPV